MCWKFCMVKKRWLELCLSCMHIKTQYTHSLWYYDVLLTVFCNLLQLAPLSYLLHVCLTTCTMMHLLTLCYSYCIFTIAVIVHRIDLYLSFILLFYSFYFFNCISLLVRWGRNSISVLLYVLYIQWIDHKSLNLESVSNVCRDERVIWVWSVSLMMCIIVVFMLETDFTTQWDV